MHLDIKPGNILIKNKHYKLCDFGLAVKVPLTSEGLDAAITAAIVDPSNAQSSSNPFTTAYNANLIPTAVEEGDTRYMARELLDWGMKNLYKCDLFSFGLSVYEVCKGEKLPSEGEQWHELRSNAFQVPRRIPLESTCIWELLSNALQADPAKRLTASSCINNYLNLCSSSNSSSNSSSDYNGAMCNNTPSSVINISPAAKGLVSKLSIDTRVANPSPVQYGTEDLITPKQALPTVFLNNMLVHNVNTTVGSSTGNMFNCKTNNALKRAHTVI